MRPTGARLADLQGNPIPGHRLIINRGTGAGATFRRTDGLTKISGQLRDRAWSANNIKASEPTESRGLFASSVTARR